MGQVLIESDWNLKIIDWKDKDIKYYVLIESDWNLKLTSEVNPIGNL